MAIKKGEYSLLNISSSLFSEDIIEFHYLNLLWLAGTLCLINL